MELLPAQNEALQRLIKLYETGERRLIVEGETGIGKTRIALEFIKHLWNKEGRTKCLVVVPRRVLINNPWIKEIEKWMRDVQPKTGFVTGELHPRLRETFYKNFTGDIMLSTAMAFHNDLLLKRTRMNTFGIVVFDEVHKIVKHSEEANAYNYSMVYKNMVIQLLAQNVTVLGLTIPATRRTVETEKHLNAVGVPVASRSPETLTYVVKIDSSSARKLDLFFRSNLYRTQKTLEKVLGKKLLWMIDEYRLEELLSEHNLTENLDFYAKILRKYKSLQQLRLDVWEGLFTRAIENLHRYFRDESGLERLIVDACTLKLLAAANLLISKVEEGKKVMVYTKFRRAARLLQRIIWDNYGLIVETFMGGDPSHKLQDVLEKDPAVIFTPVAKEGLDMPEFDVLIHLSSHADEFTRRQIRGRIRGGEEYYVVFDSTNDEYKLFRDDPEPEEPMHVYELTEVKLPVSRLAYNEYVVGLAPTDRPPYLTVPWYLLSCLVGDARGTSACLGRMGELLATYHYESAGKRCFKISSRLLRKEHIVGLNPKQLTIIRGIASVIPNPPFDLLVIGGPTPMIVEVKTTTKRYAGPLNVTQSMLSFCEQMIKTGIEPVLATVHVNERSREKIKLTVDRRRYVTL